MNAWQIARQLKKLLEDRAWPDGAQENVFGTVKVSARIPEATMTRLRMPAVLIAPDTAETDNPTPDIELNDLILRVIVRNDGDQFGEAALIGGARGLNGQGSSQGRGLMEIEEELLAAANDVAAPSGAKLRLRGRSRIAAADFEGLGYVVIREYRWQAWCTTLRSYAPASRVLVQDLAPAGEGRVIWTVPATRYDSNTVMVRRLAGATPPASITDGDLVVESAFPLVSTFDTPGAGEFSYSVFVGYDEANAGSSDRYSPAASGTGTIT